MPEEDIINGFKIKSKINNLYCSICIDLINKPVSLINCKHIFCKDCIEEWKNNHINTNIFNCPLCRKNNIKYTYAHKLEKKIKYMKVYCKNEGCEFIIAYEKRNDHLKKCIYGEISCEHCNYNGIKKNHKISKCYDIIIKKLNSTNNQNMSLQKIANNFQIEIDVINNLNVRLKEQNQIKDAEILKLRNKNNNLIKRIEEINSCNSENNSNVESCCIM